jgi:hypothetical protein
MKTKNFYDKLQVNRHYLHRGLSIFLLSFIFVLSVQAQEKEWDKTLGGGENEFLYEILQTNDSGYIVVGSSLSGATGDKTDGGRGLWIVKLNEDGNKEWDKTYAFNYTFSVVKQTKDGGYIMGGSSNAGISDDKSEPSRGEYDYWVVKLSSNGDKEWDKTFGGNRSDWLEDLQQTSDGGYILGGSSYSDKGGDKTEAIRGKCVSDRLCNSDYWVVKIDADGNKEWDRTYGGAGMDQLTVIRQTTDGGYILGGDSDSKANGNKSEDSRGPCESEQPYDDCTPDYWVVKIDADGDKEWDRTYGGLYREYLTDIQQTLDGGYVLGGHSDSRIGGDKTDDNRNEMCEQDLYFTDCPPDYWMVKLDANGNKEWDKTIGGSDQDLLTSLKQTSDGGYILGGYSSSGISGDKTQDKIGDLDYWSGNTDYWVVKLDANGDKKWDRTLGGNASDRLYFLDQTSDGGYILGGISSSDISGDKSEPSRGGYDYWIVKLSGEEPCTPPTPSIAVIPTSDVYTGGDPSTLYLGYGPQSVQLVASGAERYEWSPTEELSDAAAANPTFTPTAAGTYAFTLTAYNGECAATATVTITVVDVRCGNGKVLLCHKGKQLCLPPAAVAAHLRNHQQDRLGSCSDPVADQVVTITLPLSVFPNPFRDWAKVAFSLSVGGGYRLELYSASGRMIGVVAEGQGEDDQQVHLELRGEQLREGIYYLRLITPDQVQTLRLVLKK